MTTASLLANVADGARQRTHDEGRACRLRFSGLRARRGDPFSFFEVSVRVCVCVCVFCEQKCACIRFLVSVLHWADV